MGTQTSLSTHLLIYYPFGSKGSYVPSVLLGGTRVGLA
nr:hypothetical protein [Moritella sp. JT01]